MSWEMLRLARERAENLAAQLAASQSAHAETNRDLESTKIDCAIRIAAAEEAQRTSRRALEAERAGAEKWRSNFVEAEEFAGRQAQEIDRLVAAQRQAEQEVARMRDRAETYGHQLGCSCFETDGSECDCILSTLVSKSMQRRLATMQEPLAICTGSGTCPPELQGQSMSSTLATHGMCGICCQTVAVAWSPLGPGVVVHPYAPAIPAPPGDGERVNGKLEALRYIDGWIDNKLCQRLVPAASAILGDMRVHILAAISRIQHGDYMEARTPLADTASDLREQLADLAHRQWSGWMRYLFGKCVFGSEAGSLEIPAWAVERWKRQAATNYVDLSPAEKDSDRTEADKFLAVFQSAQPARAPADAGEK